MVENYFSSYIVMFFGELEGYLWLYRILGFSGFLVLVILLFFEISFLLFFVVVFSSNIWLVFLLIFMFVVFVFLFFCDLYVRERMGLRYLLFFDI